MQRSLAIFRVFFCILSYSSRSLRPIDVIPLTRLCLGHFSQERWQRGLCSFNKYSLILKSKNQKYCVLPTLSHNYVVFGRFFGIPTYHCQKVLRITTPFPYLRGFWAFFWYSDIPAFKSIAYYQLFPIPTRFFGVFLVF